MPGVDRPGGGSLLAECLLHLLLEGGDKLFVAFIGDDREHVRLLVKNAKPALIDDQLHSPADLLALLDLGDGLVECTNLADVRVVPALAQSAVREDERYRLVEG